MSYRDHDIIICYQTCTKCVTKGHSHLARANAVTQLDSFIFIDIYISTCFLLFLFLLTHFFILQPFLSLQQQQRNFITGSIEINVWEKEKEVEIVSYLSV
jgi:NADH:ubiquinone oxidoreductase subunit B-like Fe-S oxidoreductase